MNSDTAILVEGLSKRYFVGHQTRVPRYHSLRDNLVHTARNASRKTLDLIRGNQIVQGDEVEDFWALDDVSFEVKRGEAVGIIGRNGAGKSTLLKVLSRITEPTRGRIIIRGRVASLLEVGTGFHPELTGRENIFLNGAILGMTRREIASKFDAIVDFAEVEKFLDTPVKHYSSGMYVRLAFAVAAHLEPDILIVDEVLAVGDTEFQRKCLGKTKEVATAGRTVLFVSHNLPSMQQLCSAGIILDHGKLVYRGSIGDAISTYMSSLGRPAREVLRNSATRPGERVRVTDITFHDLDGRPMEAAICGQALRVRIHYQSNVHNMERRVDVGLMIATRDGVRLTCLGNVQTGQSRMHLFSEGYIECLWPKLSLRSGTYSGSLYCNVDGDGGWTYDAFELQVEDGDYFGTGHLAPRFLGDLVLDQSWNSAPAVELRATGS